MAKQEFLDNFRIARNLFRHPRVEASPELDGSAVAQLLARAAIWLTPKSVKGFDLRDFPELGAERKKQLEDAIASFLFIARQVPPDDPASDAQFTNAAAALEKAIEILEPYLPAPGEGGRVEAALRRVDFPQWVLNWDYELGSDQQGDAAVWVDIFVDRRLFSPSQIATMAPQMTRAIHQALSANGVSRWPYLRFRTDAEHRSSTST